MERAPERRTRVFSLEPYINAGGNYGADMAVNKEAVSKIFLASAFSRDIYVGKKVGGRHVSADVNSNAFVSDSGRVEVQKSTSAFYINVDDQQIAREVDEGTKEYRNQDGDQGRKVQSRQFVEGFNRKVASGLNRALASERLDFRGHGLDYISIATVVGGWTLYIYGSDPSLIGVAAAANGYLMYKSVVQTEEDLQKLRSNPNFLPFISREPSLSPLRYFRGYWQILRNQANIIVARDSSSV